MSKLKTVENEMKKYVVELKEQLQHLNDINSNTKIFVEKMSKVIPEKEYLNINARFIEFQNLQISLSKNITEYDSFLNQQDNSADNNAQTEEKNDIKFFTKLHLIYDELTAAFNLVRESFNFIMAQNYTTLYTENMSQTFISKMKYDITQIETAINNYFLYTAKNGKEKITEICYLLTKNLTNVAEEYIKQPLIPNLITSLVAQNLIKLGRKLMVLEKLESFKQNSLFNAEPNANTPESSKFNFSITSSTQLSRFNLMPSGEFMPLASYINKNDPNWKIMPLVIKAMQNAVILGANESSANAFAKLANFYYPRHNLYILNCGGFSHQPHSFIEFNMLPLVDSNYIKQHEMQTAEKSGLNNRIIRRFETVKEHTVHGGWLPFEKKENNSEIKETNSEQANTPETNNAKQPPNMQEILEIMWLGSDNFLYRKCIQLDSKGNKPTDKSYMQSKVRENNLLGFAVSSRPHLYNKIIESKVIGSINPKHREVMEKYMSEPIFIPPKQELHEFIKTTANEVFDKIFAAFSSRDKLTNLQKLRKFYEDEMDAFTKIVEPAILQYYSYKPDVSNLFSATMQKEANLSLVVILDLLCDKFAQQIRKNIEKMLRNIDKNLFVQYTKEDEIKSQIKGYFLKVIDDTFDALDAKPSLWEEIEPQLKMFYF